MVGKSNIESQRINNLQEFIQHAPKIISDFEKAILAKNIPQIELLAKISRTLFQQINRNLLAKDFHRYTKFQNFNPRATESLIKLAKKQIHLSQIELDKLSSKNIKPNNNNNNNNNNMFDLGLIQKLIGDNKNALNELIEMYAQQSTEYLTLMHHAFEKGDLKKIRKIAHTMKSSFTMIGFEILKKLANQIENCCEAGNLSKERLLQFDKLVKESIQLLKKEAKSKILL